jgi:hypothetical protein
MADQFIGDDVVVEFGADDISGTARTVTVAEEAPAPDSIDATHKGDTARNLLEGLPGAVETNVTLEGLDEVGGVATIFDQVLNSQDTLFIYPEGNVHGYPLLTIQNARFHGVTQNIPYDDVVSFTASFNAKNTVTRGTYDTT